MKKTVSLVMSFLLLVYYSHAQQKVYKEISIAKTHLTPLKLNRLFHSAVIADTQKSLANSSSAIGFSVNQTELARLETQQASFLNLTIPSSIENAFELELIPIQIYGPQFKLLNASNQEVLTNKTAHYKGVIKGDSMSLVALSISHGELSGFISNKKGNYVLGKLKNSKQYILYNEKDLLRKNTVDCGVTDGVIKKMIGKEVAQTSTSSFVACNPIQLHLEADHKIYQDHDSSMVSTTGFLESLFTQVAVLYNNENISIQISEMKIWDTADPFLWTVTFQQLYHAYVNYIGEEFNGHLAHFISGRALGGGMGALDVLCSKGKSVSTGIDTTVVEVPAYSWSVKQITHELGHNLGSLHTHNCAWPGGPIDNCWTAEPYPNGGMCASGPPPYNGGTIMSYCQHTAQGINFSLGFGPLPGNFIRNRVQACLGNTIPPTELSVINIYRNTAHLLWNHAIGEGDYVVEYKPASSSTWLSKTTDKEGLILTGLLANTLYDWRVKVDCSVFSASTFVTNNQPPVDYCHVYYTYSCENWQIKIASLSFNNVFFTLMSGCPASGEETFYFKPIRNFSKGQVQNFKIYMGGIGGPFVHASIWIDFNKNGIFETTDRVFVTKDSINTEAIAGTFVIPDTVVTQYYTRMRIILATDEKPLASCNTYMAGETEDYLISILGDCQQAITLNHPLNDIVAGGQTIQASATLGVMNVANHIDGTGTMATYQSNVINLYPGFKAEKGTIFKAETGGCN